MTSSVRESSDSRDGSLCESSLNNSPAERRAKVENLIRAFIGFDVEKIPVGTRYSKVKFTELIDAILSSDLVGMDQKKLTAQSDHQTEQSAHIPSPTSKGN